MNRPAHHGREVRTGKDRFQDAILFVGMAREHVIRSHDAASIARMKGVTKAGDIEAIGVALAKRMEGLA